jgi:hypothetical protein
MKEFGIPMKLVNLTGATIKRVKSGIKLLGYLSEPFITQRGLRQGDALALEKVINQTQVQDDEV